MKKHILYILFVVFATLANILTLLKNPDSKTESSLNTAQTDSIKRLQSSMMELVIKTDILERTDSLLAAENHRFKDRDKQRIDSVKTLPPTGQTKYFTYQTGEPCVQNADSSCTTTLQAIRNANALFVEGDAAKEENCRLEELLVVKDSITRLKTERIALGDSISAVQSNMIIELVKDGTKKDATIKDQDKKIGLLKKALTITTAIAGTLAIVLLW